MRLSWNLPLWRRPLVAGLALLAVALHGVAAPVQPATAKDAHHVVALDAAVLDRYIGDYQLSPDIFLTITRDGGQLSAQLTGQAAAPIYPESPTKFFYKVVDAQIEFTADASARITGLILHQNGDRTLPRVGADVARAAATALSARIKAQTAQPGSAAAVRRLVDWITTGTPDYTAMTPELGAVLRKGLPAVQQAFQALGPVVSIDFVGVGNQGWDSYKLTHANGMSQVRIVLDADGIISGALVTPGP
jgi:hypothetical protein